MKNLKYGKGQGNLKHEDGEDMVTSASFSVENASVVNYILVCYTSLVILVINLVQFLACVYRRRQKENILLVE